MNNKLELIEQVKKDPLSLKNIKNQTEAICLAAVSTRGYTLQFVKEQTEKLCLEAIKQNGNALRFVKNKTESICLEAVKQNGSALEYVRNQTENVCLVAVKQDGKYLCYVEDQTDNICREALNSNFKDSVHFVKIKQKSTAMIILEASLQHTKDKITLTEIINKFSEDKEILDFYTKHKLWKYVNFSKLNNLSEYCMVL